MDTFESSHKFGAVSDGKKTPTVDIQICTKPEVEAEVLEYQTKVRLRNFLNFIVNWKFEKQDIRYSISWEIW